MDNFISPAQVGKELTERVLSAFPLSGVVAPYQQIPVSFICRTKKFEKVGGFADLSDNHDSSKPESAATAGGRSTSGAGKPD